MSGPGGKWCRCTLAPAAVTPDRPARWLAGFASVAAGPGEAVVTTVELPERAFASWDGGWQTVAGEYHVQVGHSLTDQRLTATVQIE